MKKILLLPVLLWMVSGCSTHEKVQHLSSDICQVMQEKTSRSEVESLLGTPAQKTADPDNDSERWFYYTVNKSFFKRLPLIGRKFGKEEFELVVIEFTATTVRKCTYRTLTRDEVIAQGVQIVEE